MFNVCHNKTQVSSVAFRQRFIKMNLIQFNIQLQQFTIHKTLKESYIFNKIKNLDEILSENVNK